MVRFTVYIFAVLLLVPIAAIAINASQQEWGDVKKWSEMLLAIVVTAVACVGYVCVKSYAKSYIKHHHLL